MQGKKILIIEDNQGIRDSLKELLEFAGYEAVVAANGQEALSLLETSDTLPSIIFLDLAMPILDGFTFRKIQKSHAKLNRIPVVLMTAGGDVEANADTVGAIAYLRKPFDVDNMLDLLQRHFSSEGLTENLAEDT